MTTPRVCPWVSSCTVAEYAHYCPDGHGKAADSAIVLQAGGEPVTTPRVCPRCRSDDERFTAEFLRNGCPDPWHTTVPQSGGGPRPGMDFWWDKFREEQGGITPIGEDEWYTFACDFAQWFAQHCAEAGQQYFGERPAEKES